jgi:D-alanine--poly(phosphoribitol) ligase subunit 1
MDVIEKLLNLCRDTDPDSEAIVEATADTERITTMRAFCLRLQSFAGAIERSCAHGERIAILLPQSSDAYAAEMGALYCGRAFCPLEPSYPTDRIAYCLSDLDPRVVITDRTGAATTRDLGIRTILVDEVDASPALSPTYGECAYVIYTSGSTGRPKGVLVSRRSMNKFLEWSWAFYDVRPRERWAQFSSLGFDLSLVDLLTCVPSGGTLAPVLGSLDRMLPARFVERVGISVWHSVPSVIPLLLKDSHRAGKELRTLRVASFCGEPLYPQQAASILTRVPSVTVLNTYGPTEGTFFCSAQVIDPTLIATTVGGSLPIGDPIPGWHFQYETRPDSSLEELVIASDYLSEGYISATPDATRFGVDSSGVRTYRTGDLVRRDGSQTFFVQRADTQVKIRGNRLDLTEVEFHALQAGVIEAKAFLHEAAIFLAVNPGDVSRRDLTSVLTRNLPAYAVPSDILELAPLPRNANAKVDTAALRRAVTDKWGLRNAES